MKRILSVGQCQPDHSALKSFLTRHFDCDVVSTDGLEDTLRELRQSTCDLVLVNRKLDRDYSDGLDIVRELRADPATADVPVMLVTNYPEHQQLAVAAGALEGFGKLQYGDPATLDKLRPVLSA